ncbi:MAG: glycosyltransferase [Candidatus Methanoperedens sp.]|nr:glycosyltransferase [Candidatus Methanoperedens sp.]
MNILFLQPFPCIRAYKEAYALKHISPDMKIFLAYQGPTLNEEYGSGDEIFDGLVKLPSGYVSFYTKHKNSIQKVVNKFDIDLIHSHNSPDVLTFVAIRNTNKPVIHDIHDMYSLINKKSALCSTPKTTLEHIVTFGLYPYFTFINIEKYCNRNADGIIVVSEYMKKQVEKQLKGQYKDILVLPNFVLKKNLIHLESHSHHNFNKLKVVFEGIFGAPKTHGDLTDTINALGKISNIEFHIYGYSWNNNYVEYLKKTIEKYNNIVFHGGVSPEELFTLLPQYDCGIIPSYNTSKFSQHLHSTLPNKLFEYLICGLPVLAPNFESLRIFMEKNQVGCIYSDLESDLKNAIERMRKEHTTFFNNITKDRELYTMEKNAYEIIKLYEKILN